MIRYNNKSMSQAWSTGINYGALMVNQKVKIGPEME